MRLICPNCGAEYDAPGHMVPAGGRYVRCSACQTQWFARNVGAAQLSEDQIIARLEARGTQQTPRPPVWSDPEPMAAPAATQTSAKPGNTARPASPSFEPPKQETAPLIVPKVAETGPTKTPPASPPPDPAPQPTNTPGQEALEDKAVTVLSEPVEAIPAATSRPVEIRSGFGGAVGRGLAFGFVLGFILFLGYLAAPQIAATPTIGPIVSQYAKTVDELRAHLAWRFPQDE